MREGWTYKTFGEVGSFLRGKSIQKADFVEKGLPCIHYGQIHTKFGVSVDKHLSEIPLEVYNKSIIASYGDVIIALTSEDVEGSCKSTAWLGDYDIAVGSDAAVYKHNLNSKFVVYYLRSNSFYDEKQKYARGFKVTHIKTADIAKIPIPIPPLSEQQRIVSELDLLSSIIEKKKAQLKEYDQLAQSIFYDMFGDPMANEKGWEVNAFGNIASFKNGINYHPKNEGYSIKCIGVGDFQDRRELRDFNLIRDLTIDEVIDESYYLKDGDIIIVRSNGSKELVGRNMIVYPQDKKVTYSGFCIRCRLNSLSFLPIVLNRILSDRGTMMVLRQEGRGCNISNINQKILSSLPIILPPLPLQQSFASKIEAIERLKALVQQSITEAETLFNSRMDYWFS